MSNAAVGAYGTALSSVANAYVAGQSAKLQTKSFIAQVQAQGEASRENIEAGKENYLRNAQTRYEQLEAINRELGSVMSRQGLEAMKAEARLRTAGASTGLQGTSIDTIANQSGYDLLFDNQVAISRSRNAEVSTQRQLVSDWLNFEALNRQQAAATEGAYIGDGSSIIGAVLGGIGTSLEAYSKYGMSNSSSQPTYSDGSPMTNITPNE